MMHGLEDNFQELAKSMEAMMDSMMSPSYFRSSGRDTWDPALNVYELCDRIVVCVELAGIHPGNLDVQAENGVLHIRGHRAKPDVPDAVGEISVHLMEIDSGKFHRKIPVPRDVNFAASKASYKSGYVWIVLPRAVAADTEMPT
jgi:HSP20 family protein